MFILKPETFQTREEWQADLLLKIKKLANKFLETSE